MGVLVCRLCFNPPRSAGSGESYRVGPGRLWRHVSIRPGARAPGNQAAAVDVALESWFQSAPERGLRGIGHRAVGNGVGNSFNPPRSAGSGESPHERPKPLVLGFNPPRSAGSGESPRRQWRHAKPPGFNPPRSAGSGESPTYTCLHCHHSCFNPPRSAGSGESWNARTCDLWPWVSIRPGARAPGNPRGPGPGLPTTRWFQSAPERGLRGINLRRVASAVRQGFNPPRSAGSGESICYVFWDRKNLVSIRPGARAPGNPADLVGQILTDLFQSAPERGLRGIMPHSGLEFVPLVSIRPGARAPGNPDDLIPMQQPPLVSIRPGARAPGNRDATLAKQEDILFQSAPERGLRGIHHAAGRVEFHAGFNPPRSAGSGESLCKHHARCHQQVSIRPGARAPGNLEEHT